MIGTEWFQRIIFIQIKNIGLPFALDSSIPGVIFFKSPTVFFFKHETLTFVLKTHLDRT